MTATARQTRECHLCHRIGYAQFVPWGSEGWECSNDRACAERAATRPADNAPERPVDSLDVWVAAVEASADSGDDLAEVREFAKLLREIGPKKNGQLTAAQRRAISDYNLERTRRHGGVIHLYASATGPSLCCLIPVVALPGIDWGTVEAEKADCPQLVLCDCLTPTRPHHASACCLRRT